MERFKLPVWLQEGPQVTKLATAFGDYWDKVEDWVKTPLQQTDAETCHVAVLKLLAYQRDIDRFADEPEDLFRKRVAFAVKNAQDAGSAVGMKEIFERFGVPLRGQVERDPDKDWDVITLWMADNAITQDPELGQYIVRKYGRTCRRYEFLLIDLLEEVEVSAVSTSVEKQYHTAAELPDFIFEDEASGFAVGPCVTTSLERNIDGVGSVPDWALADTNSGMYLGFASVSLERSVDMIRSND